MIEQDSSIIILELNHWIQSRTLLMSVLAFTLSSLVGEITKYHITYSHDFLT